MYILWFIDKDVTDPVMDALTSYVNDRVTWGEVIS